jgi:hypothetical protein
MEQEERAETRLGEKGREREKGKKGENGKGT